MTEPVVYHTPELKRYFEAKAEHPGVLMLALVGDFFEAYGEDAFKLWSLLGFTIAETPNGTEESVTVSRMPFHVASKTIKWMLMVGIPVAIVNADGVEFPQIS